MGQKLVFDETGESHSHNDVGAPEIALASVPNKRKSEQKRVNLRQKKVKEEQEYHNRQYGEKSAKKQNESPTDAADNATEETEKVDESQNPVASEVKEESAKDKKARLAAIDYLNTFITDKKNWKFQKVRQIWILQNLYYQHQLDNEQFKHALQYIKGMGQRAKDETIREAQELVNVEEGTIKKRAKKIIKLL